MADSKDVKTADTLATVAEELVKIDQLNETWKDKLMRLLMALLYERKNNQWVISVGRVSWWLAFGPALYIWTWVREDITEHHLTVLLLLAGYNFGKKVVDGFVNKKLTDNDDGPG